MTNVSLHEPRFSVALFTSIQLHPWRVCTHTCTVYTWQTSLVTDVAPSSTFPRASRFSSPYFSLGSARVFARVYVLPVSGLHRKARSSRRENDARQTQPPDKAFPSLPSCSSASRLHAAYTFLYSLPGQCYDRVSSSAIRLPSSSLADTWSTIFLHTCSFPLLFFALSLARSFCSWYSLFVGFERDGRNIRICFSGITSWTRFSSVRRLSRLVCRWYSSSIFNGILSRFRGRRKFFRRNLRFVKTYWRFHGWTFRTVSLFQSQGARVISCVKVFSRFRATLSRYPLNLYFSTCWQFFASILVPKE